VRSIEDCPADAPGHAHHLDVLVRTFREIALQIVLPDPHPWGADEVDPDPLSPESLSAQTSRLVTLIERARDQKDFALVHSLRRELLLTRWTLVQSRSVRKDSRRDPSDQRDRFQPHGRHSEVSAARVTSAASSTPKAPQTTPRG
jgi:hypothetical protein